MPTATKYKENVDLRPMARAAVIAERSLRMSQTDVDQVIFIEAVGKTRWLGLYIPIQPPFDLLTDCSAFIAINVRRIKQIARRRWKELCRKVILHELMHHAGKKHDVEDFKVLLKRWGIDWGEGRDD